MILKSIAGTRLSDRLAAGIGAAVCIPLAILVCAAWPGLAPSLPVIVAPIGASAVLVFAVPASPLAQPWSVVGGNALSALVGIAAYRIVPQHDVAAGMAVGGAILTMSLCRCLHPPGGAAALTAVIGGDAVHAAGFSFALVPVALNSVALVALGMLFHRLSGRSYPHRAAPHVPTVSPAEQGLLFEDIDRALADIHEEFDISREDLEALLERAEVHALERRSAGR